MRGLRRSDTEGQRLTLTTRVRYGSLLAETSAFQKVGASIWPLSDLLLQGGRIYQG